MRTNTDSRRLAKGRVAGWLLAAVAIGAGCLWPIPAPAADTNSALHLRVDTDRPDAVYALGQTIHWRLQAKGDSVSQPIEANYGVRKGGLTVAQQGKITLTNGVAELESSATDPGTLLFELTVPAPDGKTNRALGGAVIAPDRIQPSAARPDDFDAFWKEALDELAKSPANPRLTSSESGKAGVDYWQITMDNIGGSRIHGQLARPAGEKKLPAMLNVQWAGVYGLQKSWAVDRAAPGWLVLNILPHDLPIDQPPAFYEEKSKGPLNRYWALGNDRRETSYFRRMYLSCYRAAQYLVERPDWDGQTLLVTGSSQGGMQSLMTAALHPGITAAIACVPAGCDLAGPEAGRKPGWPAWYYETQGKDRAEVIRASRYYDVVNFASRIRCPVLVGVGLVDETCPPAGILAAMNQVKAPKDLVLLPHADHQGVNNTHQAFRDREIAWQNALLAGKAVPPAKP